jgi:hypothetical protein
VTGGLSRSSQTPKRILVLLIALTLIRGLIYAAVTIPWWAGHDEEFHFAHVRMLIDQRSANDLSQDPSWPQEMVATFAAFPAGRWSRWPESQINSAEVPDRYVNFVRPSLSYYPYIWLGLFLTHQDLLFQLLAMRLVSVSITCGTIIFAFLSARQIFADSLMMQVLVPWLVLFNPAFMVMASTVSDGNLAILLSTIVFYLLVGISKRNALRRLPLAFGLTILAIGTKPTAYFLILMWGLLLATQAWKLNWKHWVAIGITGSTLIISLLFVPTRLQVVIARGLNSLKSGISFEWITHIFSISFVQNTFAFFWIILGWAVYFLAEVWYIILFLFVLLAITGLLLYGWRHLKKDKLTLGSEQKGLLLSLLFAGVAIVIFIGLGVLNYQGIGSGTTTRYIFPTIVPLSILMVAGWRALLPTTWRGEGLAVLAVAFFLFDTMVWFNYAIPWYYPFWPH